MEREIYIDREKERQIGGLIHDRERGGFNRKIELDRRIMEIKRYFR